MRRLKNLLPWAAVVALVTGMLGETGVVGPDLANRALAGSIRSVDAWITVGSDSPALGCVVDVAVEVREAGMAVAGAEVAASLIVDDALSTSDLEMTGGEGVANLRIDTGWAYEGANAWLDVNVGGTYVGGTSVSVTADGPCSGAGTMATGGGAVWVADVPAGDIASAGAVAEVAGEAAAAEASSGGTFLTVPNYVQARNLSCEYAALSIATGALGYWVSEYQFDDLVGWSANPHWGYRGDINGSWGNTTDYGVYAAPLAAALPAFGFSGHAFYGAGDASPLIASLDAGRPTLVWLGLWGDTGYAETLSDGTSFTLAAGYHVVVAYGYDDWGVYVSDPANGSNRAYDWGTFMAMWGVLDGMALGVSG
ncbi:MAG: C39 family peptidase [Chloroflexia bacterium]|nr:C39 family peptidase [Chloroflexia bacterium]